MNEVQYGRLKPLKNSHRRLAQGVDGLVDVSFWISNREPPYARGAYLRFVAGDEEYRIYNPLRLKFSMSLLVSFLKTFFRKTGHDAHSFQIVEESRRKNEL